MFYASESPAKLLCAVAREEALEEAVKITDDLIDTVMEEYSQWMESVEEQADQASGDSYEKQGGCHFPALLCQVLAWA